jgi:prepilin-type N-terminal cleavage/methylation domain-containing protein
MKTASDTRPRLRAGFTLIEIMVVVGLIGLLMGMGAPTLFRMLHREGFSKTVSEVVEVCNAARAQAILQGAVTEVVFHPQERRCELGAGVTEGLARSGAPGRSAVAVQFGDAVSIEMLDVNLFEYKDAAVARVRFFPNGTSDELTLILRSDRNEWRKISLEITTALASVDSDPHRWR